MSWKWSSINGKLFPAFPWHFKILKFFRFLFSCSKWMEPNFRCRHRSIWRPSRRTSWKKCVAKSPKPRTKSLTVSGSRMFVLFIAFAAYFVVWQVSGYARVHATSSWPWIIRKSARRLFKPNTFGEFPVFRWIIDKLLCDSTGWRFSFIPRNDFEFKPCSSENVILCCFFSRFSYKSGTESTPINLKGGTKHSPGEEEGRQNRNASIRHGFYTKTYFIIDLRIDFFVSSSYGN